MNGAGVLGEAIGTQAQLIGRFLAGDVERSDALALESRGALHEQGRLADAGLAADERDGAWDDPAAEHEVEFCEAGLPARHRLTLQVG